MLYKMQSGVLPWVQLRNFNKSLREIKRVRSALRRHIGDLNLEHLRRFFHGIRHRIHEPSLPRLSLKKNWPEVAPRRRNAGGLRCTISFSLLPPISYSLQLIYDLRRETYQNIEALHPSRPSFQESQLGHAVWPREALGHSSRDCSIK
jgi:hypothetical protein